MSAIPFAPSRAAEIDALLPQTQCGKCGYAGCRPYAEAVAAGAADINRCPPGGAELIAEIAALLGIAPKALDPGCGSAGPPRVAVIREEHCIGCTLCIQACPVDAIVGAPKLMHTVIAEACTGCELCVPPCPVDCIDLRDAVAPKARRAAAEDARRRFLARNQRLQRERDEKGRKLPAQRAAQAEKKKRETVARVLERARLRLQSRNS
ncbi:MAG TPA: RnfABCDGE type electron transport complex subunit B [Burkholderiales bacterium]|nr:RnfABCDGE type electron transport complex subunit B [Burkholderiales bacterium]